MKKSKDISGPRTKLTLSDTELNTIIDRNTMAKYVRLAKDLRIKLTTLTNTWIKTQKQRNDLN